jgi:hypothetical protein
VTENGLKEKEKREDNELFRKGQMRKKKKRPAQKSIRREREGRPLKCHRGSSSYMRWIKKKILLR